MHITEEQEQNAVESPIEEIRIPISELVVAIWQRRRLVALASGIGFIVSVCATLLMPNMYKSTAQLMPPDALTLANASALDPLAGEAETTAAAAMESGWMETRTPAGTLEGILRSRTSEDDIVKRFNLLSVYRCKYSYDARKTLADSTDLSEDKQSGIITIVVTDKDKKLARDLTAAYIDELNKLLSAVNSSAARREREFLGDRLKSIKDNLDATSAELSKFSSQNATLNPQSQGQALMDAAAKLQGELITAQSQLDGLRAQYSDDNVRVREARASVAELQSQLRKMGGIGTKSDNATLNADQLYPSLRELPILGTTYTNLYRQLTIQESLYETLTKQYEIAKVEEAKEVPVVKVLDEPIVPERKSSPHRTLIVLLLTLLSAIAATGWIVSSRLWKMAGEANPIKAFGSSILRSIRAENASKADPAK